MSVAVHFIQTFAISHGGKPLIEGQLNTSVSRNPLFAFRVRGIKAGDKLNVSWLDNLGERRQDEFTVG
jgi:sulfur-oxidizing protein SoxZ